MFRQDPTGASGELFASFCQTDAAGHAGEELNSDFFLELSDLHADGGLGNVQALCSSSERPGLCDRDQGA